MLSRAGQNLRIITLTPVTRRCQDFTITGERKSMFITRKDILVAALNLGAAALALTAICSHAFAG